MSLSLISSEPRRPSRLAPRPASAWNGAEPHTMAHNRIEFLFTPFSHVEQASGAGAERPRCADSLSNASRGRDSDAAAELAHIDAPHRNPQCVSHPPAVLDSGGDDRRLAEAPGGPS